MDAAPSSPSSRARIANALPTGIASGVREREHSVGAWSISSVGTGDSRGAPSPSVTRSGSRRIGKGVGAGRSTLAGGPSSMKRKQNKHGLALRSIRAFLKERSCYDCLPVSFRLVVLDTKLIVKPALDIMWQAGIVSAPLWQSTSDHATDDRSHLSTPSPHGEGTTASEEQKTGEANDIDAQAISPASLPASSVPSTSVSAASPFSSSVQTSNAIQTGANNNTDKENTLPPGKTGFAGMLTVHDIIHLIQYFYENSSTQDAAQNVERFRLGMLGDIEHSLHVPPPPLLSIDPMRPIFDACQLLMKTHARRLPLLDHDEQTGSDVVVNVLTQYRVLKFIAMNCRETAALHRSIRSLGIGTYAASATVGMARSMTMSSAVSSSRRSSNAAHSTFSPSAVSEASAFPQSDVATSTDANEETARVLSPTHVPEGEQQGRRRSSAVESLHPLATVTLDTTVFDAVHIFSELGISGLPVLDEEGNAVDLYETVDVIDLVRSNANQSLDLPIREALARRPKDFTGVMTVSPDDSLATIFALLRSRRVHRMLILEPEPLGPTKSFGTNDNVTNADAEAEQRQRAVHSAVASDTSAVVDSHVGTAQQQHTTRPAQTSTSFNEVPRRKRGKLLGILCLSDILRYIIQSSSDDAGDVRNRQRAASRATSLGGAMTGATVSTAASSLDPPHEMNLTYRSRQGSGESASGAPEGISASESKPTTETSSQSEINLPPSTTRFDPTDVPPTIEEHPSGDIEAATPPPSVLHVDTEDQTPTQEKPAELSE